MVPGLKARANPLLVAWWGADGIVSCRFCRFSRIGVGSGDGRGLPRPYGWGTCWEGCGSCRSCRSCRFSRVRCRRCHSCRISGRTLRLPLAQLQLPILPPLPFLPDCAIGGDAIERRRARCIAPLRASVVGALLPFLPLFAWAAGGVVAAFRCLALSSLPFLPILPFLPDVAFWVHGMTSHGGLGNARTPPSGGGEGGVFVGTHRYVAV
jgi:hypothetical protein